MRYSGNNIKTLVNKLWVSYTDEGADDAPVIIFIHGFPLNKSMWDNQMKALKENYWVIAYDIRGHGGSDAGNKEFSIKLFTHDLLAFMDFLKIEKASLCGLSMGGYIALNAVVHHPERFDAIVLSDTNCKSDSPVTKEKRLKTIGKIEADGVAEYAERSVKNLFAESSFETKLTEILAVKQMIVNTSKQSLAKTIVALSSRSEICTKLKEIKLPVLILLGEEDKISPLAAAKLMNGKIKSSALHIIKKAGHLSNMEQPDEFNSQLITFFESVYNEISNTGTSDDSSKKDSILNQLQNKISVFFSF